MILPIIIVSLVSIAVVLLVWLALNFKKYKGHKLEAKIIAPGKAWRIDITDKMGFFSWDGKSYLIDYDAVVNDHWLWPRKTLYYFKDFVRPLKRTNAENREDMKIEGGNIGPKMLNHIMGMTFTKLFKTVSDEGWGLGISKKWLIILGVGIFIFIVIVLAVGEFGETPDPVVIPPDNLNGNNGDMVPEPQALIEGVKGLVGV